MTSRRRAFWVLCGAMALVTITLATVGTAVPLYAVALGADAATVGLLVALPNLFPVVLALPAGRLIDRVGASRWLVIASVGMVSAPLVVAVGSGIAALALGQLLLGLFHVVVTLSSQAYVASLGDRSSFERDYAWYATALASGRLIGPLLAGLLIDASGHRSAFVVVTGVLVASALLMASLGRVRRGGDAAADVERTSVRGASTTPSQRSAGASPAPGPAAATPGGAEGGWPSRPPSGVAGLARNVGVQLAVLSSAGVFVAIAVRQAFLPVYLESLDVSATRIGLLLSLGGLAAVLVRPLMPALTRALGGAARAAVVAMLAVACSVGVTGAVGDYALLVALTALAGVGTGIGMPLSIVTVASHVDPRERGVALAMRLSLNRVAQLAAPVGIGAVITAAGFALGFALAGAALGLLALVAALLVPAFERAERPAASP